jgi:hypothetical protein
MDTMRATMGLETDTITPITIINMRVVLTTMLITVMRAKPPPTLQRQQTMPTITTIT